MWSWVEGFFTPGLNPLIFNNRQARHRILAGVLEGYSGVSLIHVLIHLDTEYEYLER